MKSKYYYVLDTVIISIIKKTCLYLYFRCPKNYTCIQRTYDMDADADLWRENNLLFGRQSTRYLCISKTEGVADCILQTLKYIQKI